MNMIRKPLENNASILLMSQGNELFKRAFTILETINQDAGASSVCYTAYHKDSGRGVLKEFYPYQLVDILNRDSNNQLIPSTEDASAYIQFIESEKKYIAPYNTLLKLKQSDENQDLATFIPEVEIYHGCDDKGRSIGTTYIWTPQPKLITFDKICSDIHEYPTVNSDRKLFVALTAIESLTKCICTLHKAGLIHRDIKPSNFGFIQRGDETLTQSISLFDIDTICSVFDEPNEIVGTDGYMESESGYEQPTNQTDIYAIGATLFYAIIITKLTKKNHYKYKNLYYKDLEKLVDSSILIQSSGANERLRQLIENILKKSLCDRRERYSCCEDMLVDLKEALYYALPFETNEYHDGKKWVLEDIEKYSNANMDRNAQLNIQYHLYQYPLHTCLNKNESSLNVLVVGFKNFGQKFLDTCLSAGQMLDKQLNVTVIANKFEKLSYLSKRPELSKFFNIDRSLSNFDNIDVYGNIKFDLESIKKSDDENILNIIFEYFDSFQPHYIFISLGDDQLNFSVAKEAADLFEKKCLISFVKENNTEIIEDSSGLYPVYVNKKIEKNNSYDEIERMAFNAHLIWNDDLNLDYKKAKRDFKKSYNHDSCVSNVLSIKSKLYSLGINLDENGFDKSAKLFQELISNSKNKDIKDKLIWLEHKRWVTEKICLGWTRITNLKRCIDGTTKDERNKKHICIVRSKPGQLLNTEKYIKNNHDKWNHLSHAELEKFDELDRLSVELHNVYAEKAKDVLNENLLDGHLIKSIKTFIENDKNSMIAFQEWFTCLKAICNKDIKKAKVYKKIENNFLKSTINLSNRKSIQQQVKAFDDVFYSVLASMTYHDWKNEDVKLIENIPFILTYSENICMCIPFATGANDQMFSNVASATVVSPKRILYFYFAKSDEDVNNFQKTVEYIINYMRKKQLKSFVDFLIFYTNTEESKLNDIKSVKQFDNSRIKQVKCIRINNFHEITTHLNSYINNRFKDEKVIIIEKNDKNTLSVGLQGADFYDDFANYKFDVVKMAFENTNGCDMLQYINMRPCITVSDMTAFKLSSSFSSNGPEFFDDYQELWNRYNNNTSAWKSLCDDLSKYSEGPMEDGSPGRDEIVSFSKQKNKSPEEKKYIYLVPFMCKKTVSKILEVLKKYNILESRSCIDWYTTDSCKVTIIDQRNYRKKYDLLFSDIYSLMLSDDIDVYFNDVKHSVIVKFNDLMVDGVRISPKYQREKKELIKYFAQKGYILNVYPCDGGFSFTYATKRIKDLLTTAGRILEIYTYHKSKETGAFDDIESSYAINWEETNITNEFDCIMTKDFRSLFVECKARSKISSEFYDKLLNLTNQFGINATGVLIADTRERDFYDTTPFNIEQRKRGNMMNIITVWKRNEIDDIGNTLLKIINGEYISKEEKSNV